MAGSPCPAEIMRKLKTNMNMKEITVSGHMSCTISKYAVVKPIRVSPPANKNIMFLQIAYGTTENSGVAFMGFPQDIEELKINTVGCIMHHTEVCLIFHTSPMYMSL